MSNPLYENVDLSLDIENIYDDEVVNTSYRHIGVDRPTAFDEHTLDEWAMEQLFGYTGTGRTDGESTYIVTITTSTEPALQGLSFTFG